MSSPQDFTPSTSLHYKPIKELQRNISRPTKKFSVEPTDEKKAKKTELWGSNHAAGWLSYMPSAFIPYIQITRLYSPAPVMLVYLPHLFGLLYAAIALGTPFNVVLRSAAILFGGSVFYSNAIHVWDDVIDAPIDALIERTKHRPIPRGAITKTAACIFMLAQAVCAFAFFAAFPGGLKTIIWAVPSIAGTAYYPYAKRHTNVPQLVLGLFLAWAVVIGALILGVDAVESKSSAWPVNVPLSAMVLGCTAWTMIYDTVYGHLDLENDLRLGVGSMAVLFQGHTKQFLWTALTLMVTSLTISGVAGGFGFGFFLVAVGGSLCSLACMVANVNLEDPKSIGWWFGNGFWYPAGAIGGGLMLEYLSVSGVF
jgi:4-hydroxybenzoate polyprenyltransferase